MTPEAQHQAIAEACDYYLIRDEESDSVALRNRDVNFRGPWHRNGDDGDQFAWEDAPDYLADLNAMLLAETNEDVGLDLDKWVAELAKVVLQGRLLETHEVGLLVRATAAQRAEAFLRAISKWDDAK